MSENLIAFVVATGEDVEGLGVAVRKNKKFNEISRSSNVEFRD